jgi:hypothetical protein
LKVGSVRSELWKGDGHWLVAHWLRLLTATGMAGGANRVS